MTDHCEVLQSFNMNFKRFIIAILILGASVTTSIAYAQDTQKLDYDMDNIMVVDETAVINKDVFSYGDRSEIIGTINGDVYVAGGEVMIKGQVNGDVLVAGGKVFIEPQAVITQDVRAAGGEIDIDGTINGNITAIGGVIKIHEMAKLGGSVTAAGGEVHLLAPIEENINVATSSLYINAPIAGSADLAVREMSFGESAQIGGDLSYMSENELVVNEGIVAGNVAHRFPPQEFQKSERERTEHVVGRAFAFVGLLGLIAKLFIGLLFIHILPEFNKKAANNLRAQPWRSLGTGFLVVVLTPILIIALISTIIGLPVAFIFLVGYIMAMYLSPVIVMLTLGQFAAKHFNQKWNDALAFVIGLCVLFMLSFVPVLNVITTMVVTLLGVGVLLNTKVEVYKELRKKNLL